MKDNDIRNVILEIEKSHKNKYHRGMSWEHCYLYFKNYKNINTNEQLDHASLHLGFFMASWGMLRGSSFLLQKDYRFYTSIVEHLINPKYDSLWHIDFLTSYDEKDVDLLFELKTDLENVIAKNNEIDGDNNIHRLHLIITKIIMATMGCIPAYDRYYKEGFKKFYNINVDFNKKSFLKMIDIINNDNNLKEGLNHKCLLKNSYYEYPKMKIIDLHFWLAGLNK